MLLAMRMRAQSIPSLPSTMMLASTMVKRAMLNTNTRRILQKVLLTPRLLSKKKRRKMATNKLRKQSKPKMSNIIKKTPHPLLTLQTPQRAPSSKKTSLYSSTTPQCQTPRPMRCSTKQRHFLIPQPLKQKATKNMMHPILILHLTKKRNMKKPNPSRKKELKLRLNMKRLLSSSSTLLRPPCTTTRRTMRTRTRRAKATTTSTTKRRCRAPTTVPFTRYHRNAVMTSLTNSMARALTRMTTRANGHAFNSLWIRAGPFR
ncbi:hypothetical protein EXIGLDRAFT_527923 [Exidia glandulosa HHB12029]|uniref:Uncharacterized protein n=1 Tax=Exidia glandulosa HHB12029 TaxID=1314781 RepID=A0A165IYJ9_EXIGL|nr:hypothetical protein EXIGLDRAFT_527923 [Exidia glandulosa HHB12029]